MKYLVYQYGACDYDECEQNIEIGLFDRKQEAEMLITRLGKKDNFYIEEMKENPSTKEILFRFVFDASRLFHSEFNRPVPSPGKVLELIQYSVSLDTSFLTSPGMVGAYRWHCPVIARDYEQAYEEALKIMRGTTFESSRYEHNKLVRKTNTVQ